MTDTTQAVIDKFYRKNGPCCAGCDHWRWHNSHLGDCTRRAPVSEEERHGMLGIHGYTGERQAGHVLTQRSHVCGDFYDSHDWSKEVEYEMKKVLFVCSQAKLRSKTAAHCIGGIDARYAGTDDDADIVLTTDLINWSDVIVCMEQHHADRISGKFADADSIQVWGIEDVYDYMEDELVWMLRRKSEDLLKGAPEDE